MAWGTPNVSPPGTPAPSPCSWMSTDSPECLSMSQRVSSPDNLAIDPHVCNQHIKINIFTLKQNINKLISLTVATAMESIVKKDREFEVSFLLTCFETPSTFSWQSTYLP